MIVTRLPADAKPFLPVHEFPSASLPGKPVLCKLSRQRPLENNEAESLRPDKGARLLPARKAREDKDAPPPELPLQAPEQNFVKPLQPVQNPAVHRYHQRVKILPPFNPHLNRIAIATGKLR
jgi:hypothetical protein